MIDQKNGYRSSKVRLIESGGVKGDVQRKHAPAREIREIVTY